MRCAQLLHICFSFFVSVTQLLKSASWTFLASRSFRGMDLSRWEKPQHNLPLRSSSLLLKWINDELMPFYASFFESESNFPKHPGLLWAAIYSSGSGLMHEWNEFCALLWLEWWLSSAEPLCQYNEAPVCVCVTSRTTQLQDASCVPLWGNIVFWLRRALLIIIKKAKQNRQDYSLLLFSK